MKAATSIKIRPQSAHQWSSNKRNVSMRSNMNNQKFMFTPNSQSKQMIYSLNRINAPELKRLLPKRTDFSPQRLFEENIALKKRINELNDEIRLQKTKQETVERRHAKWKKKLDVEFEKQMYWGQKGEYMVMGVKNQYDNIKKMYEDKCKQNQRIKREIKFTQLQEVKVELQVYKQQVGRLKQQLDKYVDIYKIPYNPNDEDQSSYRLLISDLKETVSKMQYELSTYQTGIKNLDKIIKDRDQKIEFLQKLVVDKDNYSYQLQQSSKRLTHQNQSIKNKNKQLKQLVDQQKQSVNFKVQQAVNVQQRKNQRQINTYESEINNKNQKITKLEAQIVYLSTLLAQWRPTESDTMKKSFEKSQDLRPISAVQKKQSVVAVSEGDIGDQYQKQFIELNRSQLDQLNQSSISKKQRNINTHYSLKRDKVKRQQIQNICTEIKYRLISSKVDFIQAKSYLKPSQGNQISIKDLIQIFEQQPFNIESLQQRIILSRYLIEDVKQNVIYYDELLSQNQVVVCSIFQQIIPKYTIPTYEQNSQILSKVIQMLNKYNTTLKQVITKYNKQMILHQKKFLQILEQQELNTNEECNNYMICHMLKSSTGIAHLNFKALLDLVQPAQEN